MTGAGREPDVSGFALHGDDIADPVLGRLVARGLHDELKGSAYAIVEGVDGRTHHLRFSDLEMTGDAGQAPSSRRAPMKMPMAEGGYRWRLGRIFRSKRKWRRRARPGSTASSSHVNRSRVALASAPKCVTPWPSVSSILSSEGLARRQGQRVVFARNLLDTLRRRELEFAASKLSSETGLRHQPSLEGEHVSGVYRQRVALASGRFAMIDDGLGFQLVPWRPALEQHLGRHVSGVVTPGGGMDWSFGRKRGLGL